LLAILHVVPPAKARRRLSHKCASDAIFLAEQSILSKDGRLGHFSVQAGYAKPRTKASDETALTEHFVWWFDRAAICLKQQLFELPTQTDRGIGGPWQGKDNEITPYPSGCAELRLNFTLQVATAATAVEVTVEAGNLITTSTSSVGEVLGERQIRDLPLVSNNVLDLVSSMAGTFPVHIHVESGPRNGAERRANGQGATFTDPTNRALDYSLLGTHRKHVVSHYGTFALPIGPQKALFGDSSGIVARLIENWQASWIVNLSSGAPLTINAQNILYGLGVPDVVGPFDRNAYRAAWAEGAANGNMFTDANNQAKYTRVRDPQCLNSNIVAPSLQALNLCTLNAIRDSSGQIVLQTPLPGTRGTLGRSPIEGLGTWTADMAIEKRIRVNETKSFTFRVDARNIFNHPTPAIPGLFATTGGTADLNLQGTVPFGNFSTKAGNRNFHLKARVDYGSQGLSAKRATPGTGADNSPHPLRGNAAKAFARLPVGAVCDVCDRPYFVDSGKSRGHRPRPGV
jgi:hypothetical protein